jgi:hypothetical protein
MALEAEAAPLCKLPLIGAFGAVKQPDIDIPRPPVVYKG